MITLLINGSTNTWILNVSSAVRKMSQLSFKLSTEKYLAETVENTTKKYNT